MKLALILGATAIAAGAYLAWLCRRVWVEGSAAAPTHCPVCKREVCRG